MFSRHPACAALASCSASGSTSELDLGLKIGCSIPPKWPCQTLQGYTGIIIYIYIYMYIISDRKSVDLGGYHGSFPCFSPNFRTNPWFTPAKPSSLRIFDGSLLCCIEERPAAQSSRFGLAKCATQIVISCNI